MAKTFKNLPRPGETTAPKPISERDFFDLSDEVEPVQKPGDSSKKARNTGNTNNTSIIGNTGNTSNTGNAGNTVRPITPAPVSPVEPTPADGASEGVRQTFVLSRGHLEQLRDYVHARRAQGEYTFSQKQALQQALDLLFASSPPVPQRPEHTRQLEQLQKERIKLGRSR